MPTYEYECQKCHHEFEQYQSFNDAELTKCPECGKETLKKKITVPLMVFVRGTDNMTLGTLAERNASMMSEDQKEHLTEKYKSPRAKKQKKPNPTPLTKDGITDKKINSMSTEQKRRYIETGVYY